MPELRDIAALSAMKDGLLRVKRFVAPNGSKPLVGSQITFAIRTIKARLNGQGSPEGNPDRPV
jgi:hypothetical protein